MIAVNTTVGSQAVNSAPQQWDLSKMDQGILVGKNSLKSGNLTKLPMYFAGASNTAILQTTITNVTDFSKVANANPAPLAGVALKADNGGSGWIGLMDVNVWSDWKKIEFMTLEQSVLSKDNPSAELTVILNHGAFYVYVDGIYVAKKAVSEVIEGTDANTKFGFGLTMQWAEAYDADIEFSNMKYSTDPADIVGFGGDTLFAMNSIKVGSTVVNSVASVWDTSKLAGKILTGTSTAAAEMKATKPMYFVETGNKAVLKTRITNKTDYTLGGDEMPMVGMALTSDAGAFGHFGIMQGNVWANWDSLSPSMGFDALTKWSDKPYVDLEVMVVDGQIYVYVDGIYRNKMSVSQVVAGATASTEFVFGLMMNTGNACTIEFSEIAFTTAAADVEAFRKANLFSLRQVQNGKADAWSATDSWDVTRLDEGILTGTQASSDKKMYFIDNGSTALFEAQITNKTDYETLGDGNFAQTPIVAMRFISAETGNTGWLGVSAKHVVYNGTYKYDVISYDVLTRWNLASPINGKTIRLAMAIKDGNVSVYVDGLFITTIAMSDIVSGATATDEFVYGLMLNAQKATNIEFSEIDFTTDETAVSNYIANH